MSAIYITVCMCPIAMGILRLYFFVPPGCIFLTVWFAEVTGFAAGQVSVAAVGQIDAHFLSDKHLETVHSLTGLENFCVTDLRIFYSEFSTLH